jgi:NCAIR mutase (PurE)-related protein
VDTARLEQLLRDVESGRASVDSALQSLRNFPYDDTLGFARLDTHRALRTGFPEVVFGQGKTTEQCVAIVRRLRETESIVLLTRANPEVGAAVTAALPSGDAVYYEAARCVVAGTPSVAADNSPFVAVCSAGTADLPVAEEAVVTLTAHGTRAVRLYDVGVAGLHRLLAQRETLQAAACVIVVAGMEGALASVVGGLVACPVVACPTSVGYGASFGDNGFGAASFAHLVLTSSLNAAAAAAQGSGG